MPEATVISRELRDKLLFHNTVMVDVNIAYPSVEGAPQGCARRFNAHYEKQTQAWRQYAGETMLDDAVADYASAMQNGYPFNTYALAGAYEVTLNALPLLSLYSDIYRYTGGAHGLTERTGDTWDFTRCKRLDMKRLFTWGYDYARPILTYVTAEAERRQADGEAQYFDGLAENIVRYFDEKNFYLSDKGLVVFYPLYSIAPYYVGIQAFTVPYRMFGNNMTYPLT